MLQYKDLTTARRKYIDLVEIHFPEIAARGLISYKEIKDIHAFFTAKRAENKNYKVMKALWLVTSNQTENRGFYFFPGSTVPEIKKENVSEWDKMYANELSRYGITAPP